MKRSHLLLDEPTYQEIRRRAFQSGKSMAAVTRELLHRALLMPEHNEDVLKRGLLELVGKFEDPQGSDVSSRHDDYLGQAFSE